jgi:hypothetical protein
MRVLRPFPVLLLLLAGGLSMLAPEAEAAGPAVTWTRVGVLPANSSAASSTLLANGEVLITGQTASNPRAWRYNPATGAITPAANPGLMHSSGTVTRLASGLVLAAGGNNSANAEIYDPTADLWTNLPPMNGVRSGHTATLLNDGRVLITGGALLNGVVLSAAEVFDPGTNTWSLVASMATAHAFHAATLLDDGRVLVAGGFNTDVSFTAAAEIYDPVANTWTSAGNMSTARFIYTAARLPDGRVLAAGGANPFGGSIASAEIYDPVANLWSAAPAMLNARSGAAAATLADGRVLLGGGDTLPAGAIASTVEAYDPVANSWAYVDFLEGIRRTGRATLLTDGTVLVSGGGNNNGSMITLELYGPDGDGDGYNDAREGHLAENAASYCAIMRADVIGDGVINSADQLRLVTFYTTLPVVQRLDQNGNNKIESGDQLLMRLNFGKNVGMCP